MKDLLKSQPNSFVSFIYNVVLKWRAFEDFVKFGDQKQITLNEANVDMAELFQKFSLIVIIVENKY